MSSPFNVKAPFKPQGDQPKAIKQLSEGLARGDAMQTLLGVTGSGKTFTMAHLIQNYGKPTLVLAHNKTLAHQLYKELKAFFPDNKVEYFISYFDYYQPESYIPATDTYVEKDSSVNPKIVQMRQSATVSLLSRPDTIIVASVSAIYGLGDPEHYKKLIYNIHTGQKISRRGLMMELLRMQYQRNDTELVSGNFRVKGNTIDVIPGYQDNLIRIQLRGDEITSITEYSMPDVEKVQSYEHIALYPAKHFVTPQEVIDQALAEIDEELQEQLPIIEQENKLFAYRLKQRVNYDMEMIKEMGYCTGIENYSRFFDRRKPGERPYCLLDFFPDDFLLLIDESHQTIPQLHGMYKGDRSRKQNLVDYGFRLPSALDNRPLRFEEFTQFMNHVVCVSATPADYELENSSQVAEMIVRPTGLVDPEVFIRPSEGQMGDLKQEIKAAVEKGQRVLVTTLTKRLAEDLTEYFANNGLEVRYLHSEIDPLERIEIIRQLRVGTFDILVGINLLREGLDIPEVGLVAILDADKEGFLRNDKSLIQIIGRAARNADAKVVLYADKMTDSIEKTVKETNRRRRIQMKYNKEHGIVPKTIIKDIPEAQVILKDEKSLPKSELPKLIEDLKQQMQDSADKLDFEVAIKLRNKILQLEKKLGKK